MHLKRYTYKLHRNDLLIEFIYFLFVGLGFSAVCVYCTRFHHYSLRTVHWYEYSLV